MHCSCMSHLLPWTPTNPTQQCRLDSMYRSVNALRCRTIPTSPTTSNETHMPATSMPQTHQPKSLPHLAQLCWVHRNAGDDVSTRVKTCKLTQRRGQLPRASSGHNKPRHRPQSVHGGQGDDRRDGVNTEAATRWRHINLACHVLF
jgi:hypothetical protein